MTCRHPAYRTRRCAAPIGRWEYVRMKMWKVPTWSTPEPSLHRMTASVQLANWDSTSRQVENSPLKPTRIPIRFSRLRYFPGPSSSVFSQPDSPHLHLFRPFPFQSPPLRYLFSFPRGLF